MISGKNKQSLNEIGYIQFDTEKLKIKKDNFFKKKKLYFIFSFLIILLLIIIYQNSKILGLSKEIEIIKGNVTNEKNYQKNIENLIIEESKENQRLLLELNNLKNELEKIKEKPDILSQIFYPYKSDIINTNEELNFIREIVKGNKIEMVYKSSINGDNSTYFYDITRNYSSYLILILSKSGRKFGAYTSLNFEGKKIGVSDFEYYKIDNKAFLFSLTDKKTFHVKKDKFALICTDDNLINFGENDLVISNNFLSQISYSDFPINFEGNEKDFKNFIGNDTFQVKEFELFHISKLED
jgi:hypothetical protein